MSTPFHMAQYRRLKIAGDLICFLGLLMALPTLLFLIDVISTILKGQWSKLPMVLLSTLIFGGLMTFFILAGNRITKGIEWAIWTGVGLIAVVGLVAGFITFKVTLFVASGYASGSEFTTSAGAFVLSLAILIASTLLIQLLYRGRQDYLNTQMDKVPGFPVSTTSDATQPHLPPAGTATGSPNSADPG